VSSATHLLHDFETVEFNSQSQVAVTNRIETKFIISENDLGYLLQKLKPHYTLLKFGEECIMDYSTLYYDTHDFDFYLAHHNKRLHRYKVRERTYEKNNKTFLELKYQSGINRIMKERIKRENKSANFQKNELEFLAAKLYLSPESLIPTVLNTYRRITLIGKNTGERVTIDLDLCFGINTAQQHLKQLVVVEVKQSQQENCVVFDILKKSGVRSLSLSKYCLGINYLYPNLKKNNFKPRLSSINQLINNVSNPYTLA
jgi:hypothetical protein